MTCVCEHPMALHNVYQEIIEVTSAMDPPGVVRQLYGLRQFLECRGRWCRCMTFRRRSACYESVGDVSAIA